MAKRKKRQRLQRIREEEAAKTKSVVVANEPVASEPVEKPKATTPAKKRGWGPAKKTTPVKEKE